MFRVGQKVVCVKSHSQGKVVKGQIYTVLGLYSCCTLNVDVGIKLPTLTGRIVCCGRITSDGVWWIKATLFAPLTEEKGEMTYEDAIMVTQNYTIGV